MEAGHLVAFVCNHCPFVIHLLGHFTEFFNQLESENIAVYLISSNNADIYPADSPSKMRELALDSGFRFLIFMMRHKVRLRTTRRHVPRIFSSTMNSPFSIGADTTNPDRATNCPLTAWTKERR